MFNSIERPPSQGSPAAGEPPQPPSKSSDGSLVLEGEAQPATVGKSEKRLPVAPRVGLARGRENVYGAEINDSTTRRPAQAVPVA